MMLVVLFMLVEVVCCICVLYFSCLLLILIVSVMVFVMRVCLVGFYGVWLIFLISCWKCFFGCVMVGGFFGEVLVGVFEGECVFFEFGREGDEVCESICYEGVIGVGEWMMFGE